MHRACEVLRRDETIYTGDDEADAADGGGKIAPGGTVKLARFEALGGGRELHAAAAKRGNPWENITKRGRGDIVREGQAEAGEREGEGGEGGQMAGFFSG